MHLLEGSKRRAVVPAVVVALALSACNASGASTSTTEAPDAPTTCLRALDLSDLLLDEARQAMQIDAQIFAGKVSAADSARRLTEIAAAQSAITPEYETAKASCRASR